MTTEIIEQLKNLEKLDRALEKLLSDKQDVINSILTDEIKEKLTEIDSEFESDIKELQDKISDSETLIKLATLPIGKTVSNGTYKAVWNKGRVSWDTRGLDGYALEHPEIKNLKVVNNPTVSIRRK